MKVYDKKQPLSQHPDELAEPLAPFGASSASAGVMRGQPLAVQMARLAPEGQGLEAGAASAADRNATVHEAADRGTRGSGGRLPYLDAIQASFGHHDVSNVQAYTGAAAHDASQTMGARAFAVGSKVAFGQAPDLHTAAHEAAHVVQQRGGVSLKGGVGQVGDPYERHADHVADLVVRGQSAESALDTYASPGASGAGQSKGVQGFLGGLLGQAGCADPEAAKQREWVNFGVEQTNLLMTVLNVLADVFVQAGPTGRKAARITAEFCVGLAGLGKAAGGVAHGANFLQLGLDARDAHQAWKAGDREAFMEVMLTRFLPNVGAAFKDAGLGVAKRHPLMRILNVVNVILCAIEPAWFQRSVQGDFSWLPERDTAKKFAETIEMLREHPRRRAEGRLDIPMDTDGLINGAKFTLRKPRSYDNIPAYLTMYFRFFGGKTKVQDASFLETMLERNDDAAGMLWKALTTKQSNGAEIGDPGKRVTLDTAAGGWLGVWIESNPAGLSKHGVLITSLKVWTK